MTIVFQERLSDSPYIETVTRGYTTTDGCAVRPAENNWHLVITRFRDAFQTHIVGPWEASGRVTYPRGAEVLWIRFKLGTFMPALPTRQILNTEIEVPGGAGDSFWLGCSIWQLPNFESADTFVHQLVRNDVLAWDPLVQAMQRDEPLDLSPRTLRHRFLRATGLTRNHVRQVERARRAAALLQEGLSILDTVDELGYFDQPHLTRALKRFVGRTPAQEFIRSCQRA